MIFLKMIILETKQKQDSQKHHICLTDYDHYFILGDIEHRDKIEYKRNISVQDDKE